MLASLIIGKIDGHRKLNNCSIWLKWYYSVWVTTRHVPLLISLF